MPDMDPLGEPTSPPISKGLPEWFTKYRYVVIPVIVIFSLVAVDSVGNGLATTVNTPSKVTVTPSGDLVGSFTLHSGFFNGGIQSPQTGGACLIADLNKLDIPAMAPGNRTCSDSAQCQGSPEWAGYCRDKKCWVHSALESEDPKYCHRSPDDPLEEGVANGVNLAPLSTRALVFGQVKYSDVAPIEWRIVTCLNGYDSKNGNHDCGPTGGSRLKIEYGDPSPIP